MKKRVTVVLEVETDDEYMLRDDVIERDLQREINCACNSYDIVDFKTEIIEVDPHNPPYEMTDEDIEDMINRLFTPKSE